MTLKRIPPASGNPLRSLIYQGFKITADRVMAISIFMITAFALGFIIGNFPHSESWERDLRPEKMSVGTVGVPFEPQVSEWMGPGIENDVSEPMIGHPVRNYESSAVEE